MAMRENRKHSAHCRLYLCAWCATSQRGGGRYSTHKPLALHLYSLNTCHMVYLVFCRVRGEETGPPQLTDSASRPHSLHHMFRILLSYHFTRSINMFHLLQLRYATYHHSMGKCNLLDTVRLRSCPTVSRTDSGRRLTRILVQSTQC